MLERPRNPGAGAPVRAPAGDLALAELDVPEVGVSKPVSTLTSVDLPAPFGPIRPTTSCRLQLSETPSSACTPVKDRETEEARSVLPGLLVAAAVSASAKT